MTTIRRRIGVLSLQGSFSEHVQSVQRAGATATEIRLPSEIADVDGLILPGGESTTILKLIDEYRIREPLREAIAAGLPVLGTCAGVICLANRISSHVMRPLGVLDISVSRNSFGRQVESFEEDLRIEGLSGPAFRGVFIRAPMIESCGDGVRVLARLADGTVVACQEGNILAACFHPEFVDDIRFHEQLLHLVEQHATGDPA
jgi:5'-phosphate synthase pdxT subunit